MTSQPTAMLEVINNGISIVFFGRFSELLENARLLRQWFGAEWCITYRGVEMAKSKAVTA